MTTNFPGSLDAFTNPSATDAMDSVTVPHATQHADLNDAVEALQAKVGVDGSAVNSSLDYKVANRGLVLVNSVTIGTAVSSVSTGNVFSSTYDDYRIVINTTCSSAATFLASIGSATTGYYTSHLTVNSTGTVIGNSFTNDNEIEEVSVASTGGTFATVDVFRPNLSAITGYQCSGSDTRTNGSWYRSTHGWLNDTTQHTYMTFYPRSGTMTGGTIKVYGYNNG